MKKLEIIQLDLKVIDMWQNKQFNKLYKDFLMKQTLMLIFRKYQISLQIEEDQELFNIMFIQPIFKDN